MNNHVTVTDLGVSAATSSRSLTFTVTATAADTVVAVTGEIDRSCSDELLARLGDELTVGAIALIADLRAVPFCACCGLSALLDIRARATGEDVPFVLVTEQRALLRPIALLNLGAVLPVWPTLTAARLVLSAA